MSIKAKSTRPQYRIVKAPLAEDVEIDELALYIERLLVRELYRPLMKILPSLVLENAKGDPLLRAIRTGKVVHRRGEFSGKFTAAVSRDLQELGAKWDSKKGVWKLLASELPEEVLSAVRLSETRFNATLRSFDETLGKILPKSLVEKASFDRFFDKTIFKLDSKINKTMRGITVAPQLTADEKKQVARDYSNNMGKYVKNFTEGQIKRLREDVEINKYSGNRYENLEKSIRNSYGVSKNKAKFLARQETNLLTASYRQARYQTAGSKGYYWRCVAGTAKHPVRDDHKLLDGKFFTWDTPPVTNRRTGARNHPGQDYNCRCDAKVVLRYDEDEE